MGADSDSVPELFAAGIALGTLLLVWSNALARRARVSPPWLLLHEFITREDVAAGLAEEAADKAKLAVLSGVNLNITSSTSGPDLESPTEVTPLIKRPAPSTRRSWHSIFFAVLGFIQVVTRAAVVSCIISQVAKGNSTTQALVTPIIFVITWSYGLFYPMADPPSTVPYPLLSIYLASLLSACGTFYTNGTAEQTTSHMTHIYLQIGNSLLSVAGIAVILNMPLELNGEPHADEEGRPPALDDYATLFQWLTFTWMSPFVSIGISRAVEETDVWQLSQLLRSRILMAKFRRFNRKTLISRLIGANALDIFLDFILTIVSTSLAVAQPYLFNLTLRALEGNDQVSITSFPMHSIAFYVPQSFYAIPASLHYYTSGFLGFGTTTWSDADSSSFDSPAARRQLAYFYATVAFIFQLVKSQADLQHLYHSRRAASRAQAELVASIYEKALVRKDITGSVASDMLAKSKDNAKKKAGTEDDKEELDEKDQPVASADVGKIVSLIATDASQCSNVANFLTRFYEVPIYIIGACYLLHSLMGWSGFTGYFVFIVVMPINYFIMKWTYDIRKIVLDVRDKRMREMNQAIQAIKFIKFFAWESRWVDRIMAARAREMGWLRKSKILYLALTITWDIVPVLVSLISFSAFVLLAKGQLTVAVAFPALQTFSLLTRALTLIPMIAQLFIQTYASFTRIDKYLNEDEVPSWVSWQSETRTGSLEPDVPFDDRIGCEDATFKWTLPHSGAGDEKNSSEVPWLARVKNLFTRKSGTKPTGDQGAPADLGEDEPPKEFELRNIDVMFKRGRLNLVSGPTGSGKSSLLSALLGEMNLISGQVFLPKQPGRVDKDTGLRENVSFCAQQPWLQHQSIRENILFGLAYDEQRYNDVLKACALTTDLALLEDGDKTEIGEKGVSLSGGQKARVALARAVYARSKTIILDDVLSAVDSHTAESLIMNCLLGPLLADRTVILVTHHVDLVVDSCAWVVQLEDGVIAAQGSPEELRERGFLADIKRAAHTSETSAGITDLAKVNKPAAEANDAEAAQDKAARKLVEKEEKAEGRVELKIYHVYISASSYLLMGISVALLIFRGGGDLAQKFWMRFWGEAYLRDEIRIRTTELNFPRPQDNVMPYLGGYVLIQFVTVALAISGQIPSIFSSLRASKILYHKMLMSVIRAPSRWFDKTPSGRILNRFSKDIDTIDSGLQMYIIVVIDTAIDALISVCTVLWGAPLFAVPLAIIGALQYWFTLGYVSVSRDLRRIESNTRSPIISSFSELVNGISTVRAFGAERFFVNSLFKRLDLTQAANYYYWMCNRWLLFRFDALGACVVLIATLMSIRSGVSPGLTGIIITQSQGVIMSLYWMLRFYTEMEQALNSVERVHEYMDIPSEPPSIIEGNRPPAYWPSNTGGISVENLVLKYSPELEPVLQGVSFNIKPTEKVGLVGRTGSGKSTLALAFFRFVDPEEGKIIIDGIDITTIGLEDLRSRLTIIPQDAVLFAGSIRENLDPFNEHSDEDCLDALRRVQLRTSGSPQSTIVPSRETSRPGTPPNGETATENGDEFASSTAIDRSNKIIITLDTQVSEGGNNFSSGQRQLIAMARALLRRSRFVVMDESTASVDFATDIKIQEAIREEFKDSILITIAHRLRTVIDYDRILVMDAGKVAEFDTPKNLIAKEDGIFRSMCLKSGDFEKLREAANRKAEWTP